MAHTSISSAAGKPDLNPAAMFQAAPSPEPSGDAGFEAALNRAREPERAESPQSSQPGPSQRSERAPENTRTSESGRPSGEKPQQARNTQQDAGKTEEAASGDTAAPAANGKAAAAEEESPAALPAEIAAVLAALAAFNGRATSAVSGEGDETAPRLTSLLSDAGKGKGGNTGANQPGFSLPGGAGKDGGDLPIAVNTKESVVQQAVTLATQTGQSRNFAEQVLAGLRGEAVNGVQGAGLPFSARGEMPQQGVQLPQLQMTTPAGQRAWATEIGQQVSWMLGRNESKAELVLTPPSLGKLGVSIHVNGEQTTAHFVAATQAARDALEQAMPRLREVLQQAGINLGQTNVSTSGDQRAHDGHGDGGRNGGWGGRDDGDAGELAGVAPTTTTSWIRSGNGVIDTFA